MLGQEVVEDTGHFVLLVLDDEWDGQGLAPVFVCVDLLNAFPRQRQELVSNSCFKFGTCSMSYVFAWYNKV